MNTGVMSRRRIAVFTSVLLSGALSLAAFAVNLGQNASPFSGAPQTVDTVSYRSNSGRHKVLIERDNAERAKNVGATRNLNYDAFQVLEVDRATADRLIASGIASNADAQNLILLNSGAVDTTAPEVFANNSKAVSIGSGKQLHLVQFPGPIKPEWYAQLEATGAQIVNAIPSNAYMIYGDAVALDNVAALSASGTAQWHGPYLSAYKLQPGVIAASQAEAAKSLTTRNINPSKASTTFRVQLVRDPFVNSVTESLLGNTNVVSRNEIAGYVNLIMTIPPEVMDTFSKRPDVISIAVYREPKRMDERQNMIMAGNLTGGTPNAGNYFTTLANWGLTQAQFTASGLVVDVTDDGADRNPTGADPGTISSNANAGPVPTRHFVLREGGVANGTSRFLYKGRWGTASTTDGGLGFSGHGQLNMSIVGGHVPDTLDTGNTLVHRDAQGFRFGLGVAPFVRLGNSVIFDPGFTSPNYSNLLSAAYVGGARISSNSWGADDAGAYSTDAQAYDILVRDSQSATAGNQQMLVVFAAGNAGSGPQTVGSPGSGKNVLTVGAGENVRSHSAANGGNPGNTTGADGCGTLDVDANNANDMATFSSRGPTADGRKKPDIIAPGTHVTGMSYVAVGQNPTSPANGLGAADAAFRADGVCGLPGGGTAGSAFDFFPHTPAQRWYTTSSGTSHSTPAVSGAAALIYQQFLNNPSYIGANRTPAGSAAPSPALIKAYMTNAARYMTGTGANDTLPSNNQGMGSVNLGTAFDNVQRVIRDQDATDRFTASGQVRTYLVTVTNASAPLRVTLAYTDKEGATSGNAFVNNLDLTVTVAGSVYKGNVFSGATSTAGGTADPRNNLESVFLPAGLAVGTPVAIRVIASNIAGQADPTVAGPNQDFALVVYNAVPAAASQAVVAYSSSTVATGNGVIDPNECNDVNVTLANNGTAGATAVSATLASSTSGVTIAQAGSAYPNIGAGTTAANLTAFKVSTSPSVVCGSTINFTQTTAYTGGASPVTSPFSLIVGSPANTLLFSQNFDGVTAPALPAGWTTARTGTSPPALFATTATNPDTAPNAAFTDGAATAATNSLISPAIALPASPYPSTLSFRHAWNFETSQGEQWDGGILELSTNGGTSFDNVTSPAVGGTFTAGGYTGTISTADTNILASEPAWGKAQATFITSTLSLPPALNGQMITLRWRASWDGAIAAANPNWRIDSISLTGGVTCATGAGVCAASAPPSLAYAPTSGAPVNFTAVTTLGSSGSGSITVTPSGGFGSGGAATSTVNTCAFSGPDAASFSGAGAVNLSFVGSVVAAQSISLNCTAGSAVRSATLTCNQTIGAGNPATQRTWPLSCPIGCSLDINGDAAVTADKDAVLLSRYLLGFRGAGLIDNVPLGAGRANAQAVETFIGSAAQFDVFGRTVPAASAMQDGIVLFRLMLGVPDTALFGGITVPTPATYSTPSTVRSNVNLRCGTSF